MSCKNKGGAQFSQWNEYGAKVSFGVCSRIVMLRKLNMRVNMNLQFELKSLSI